ncbi:hypothetical protein ABZS66_43170 [Dactylosporangium sp. NPDC005572]|uniref:hypothetical protein n=1 Tax=Dactylosporangium sp. NPDC005572 TaxID=3156889 RepID=UPI00339E18E6
MNHDLHDQFADLADEMDGTDLVRLRDRVDRRSRQLRTRRTVATSVAAVAVVAALTGGATLLQFRDQETPPPVPGTSATTSPAPATSSDPPTTAPTSSSSSPSVNPDALPGTLFYLTLQPGKPIQLYRYVDGVQHTTSFGTASSQDVYASPSPDGTRLVVNTSPNVASITPGDLVIVEAGGARRAIAHNVRFDGGNTAIWTPDGTAVIAGGVRYNPADGSHGATGANGLPYLAYSADGSLRAYVAAQPATVQITKADGSSPRAVPVTGLAECERAGCPTSVQSLSDDGRYLALGNVNSDPQHVYSTALVYDTVSRKRVELGQLRHVWFRTDGAVVDTGSQLKLYDRSWRLVHTYPPPQREEGATRLLYRP